jgi:hypothetical protein
MQEAEAINTSKTRKMQRCSCCRTIQQRLRTLALVLARAALGLPPEQATVHHQRVLRDARGQGQRGEEPLASSVDWLQATKVLPTVDSWFHTTKP